MYKTLFAWVFLSVCLYASSYQQSYLKALKNAQTLENNFKTLIVQSKGRMKPMDTLSKEVIRKLSSKERLHNLSANQLMLGMFFRPDIFKQLPVIKLKSDFLKSKLGTEKSAEYASYYQFFIQGQYRLASEVEKAYLKKASARTAYENELIKVNEKVNILKMVFNGTLFNIFPPKEDLTATWHNFKEAYGVYDKAIQSSIERFIESGFNRSFEQANEELLFFKQLQTTTQNRVKPKKWTIKLEIFFNQINIFERLTYLYLLFGFALLLYSFYNVLKPNKVPWLVYKSVILLCFVLLFLHTVGLAVRWVIGNYAPMSNTYESIIYIAYSCIIAGVLFFRRFFMALAGSFMMAGIFMFSAHLGHIDPEITTLVPVLKSFWLTIHVAIITASYGFFGLCSILGACTLILFMLNKNRAHSQKQIKTVSTLNEVSMILGLSLLVIGNFLGGVWANESWGRYWGWDPKETWSYISILVYVFILHMRFIPFFNNRFAFASLSLLAFASILMTYFGVNFYLAGMHSYATGDPVPIPTWVYVISSIVMVLIAFSYRGYKKV